MRRLAIAIAFCFAAWPALAQFNPPLGGRPPPGRIAGCQFLSTPQTLTNFLTTVLQCDAAGYLDMDLQKIVGTTALTGAGAVGAGSLRVAVGQDTTTIAGSAPGTAGTASANVITVQGIASMTPVQVSQATAANLNGLVNPLTAANWGIGATGAAVPANAQFVAARAENAEPTAATNGNLTGLAVGLEGKLINLPYANKENMVRGTASSTVNTAVTLIAAQGAGNKIYVTGLQCYRNDAGTSAITVTLNDTETTGSGTEIVLPNSGGGGGSNLPILTPLVVAANTALQFTVGTATTTVFCNAQGYFGA